MKNKKTLGIAFGIMMLLGVSLVAAYQGDYSAQGPDYSDDRHDAMQEAFESLDYDAWVTLMSETGKSSRVLEVVTEANFAIFVEANEAGRSGDVERAVELRTELGLNNGAGHKDGSGSRRSRGSGKAHKNLA